MILYGKYVLVFSQNTNTASSGLYYSSALVVKFDQIYKETRGAR